MIIPYFNQCAIMPVMQLNGKKNVNYFKFKCQALNSNSEGYLSFSILRHRALDPSGHHHRQRCLPAARPVVPGGAGGAMAPPDFGRSVNPISTKGGRLCPPNNTGTPGFSDLPTALAACERQFNGST